MDFKRLYHQIHLGFPDAPSRFELAVRSVYEQVLKEGDTSFDIGAHIGKHTLPMAHAVGETGSIYAFEPIIEKYSILEKEILKEKRSNIYIFNVCCGATSRLAEFNYLPNSPGKSSINLRIRIENSKEKRVKIKSIVIKLEEYFLEQSPAFIKIDTEGSEYHVLLGCEQIIKKSMPIIHTELGGDTLEVFGVTPEDVYSYLNKLGYRSYDILGNELFSKELFCSSVSSPRVYDYISIPKNDERNVMIQNELKKMWIK